MNARAARFPLMDSMRAIAVLLVVAYHVLSGVAPAGSGAAIRPFAAQMGVGVSIFFVISGFLLYRPFVAARVDGKRWLPARAFAWRRFLRIVPAYWVALTLIAVWLSLPGVFTWGGIPRFYLLGQVFDVDSVFAGLTQAWSLWVEVGFYVFLPLWAFALRAVPGRDRAGRLRVEWVTLAALFAAGAIWNVLAVGQVADGEYTPLLRQFPSFLDHFVAGMALAVASVALEGRERAPGPVRLVERVPSLAWAVALAAFVVVSLGVGLEDDVAPTDAQLLVRRTLYVVIAVAVVLPAVFGDPKRGLTRRLLASPALLWIGLVSYGVFLYNLAVLSQLNRWGIQPLGSIHAYLKVLDVLLPTLGLAALSYYLIERPALSLKRLVGPRTEPAPAEAIAEPAPSRAA